MAKASISNSQTGDLSERDARTYLFEDRFLVVYSQIERLEVMMKGFSEDLKQSNNTIMKNSVALAGDRERILSIELEFDTGASSHENSMANRTIRFHERLNLLEREYAKLAETYLSVDSLTREVISLDRSIKDGARKESDTKGFLRTAFIEWAPHILTWLGFLLLYVVTQLK